MRSSIVMKFADGWHIERREFCGGVYSYLVKGDIETKITPEEERRICATRRGTETITAAAIRVPVSEELRAKTWKGKPVYPNNYCSASS